MQLKLSFSPLTETRKMLSLTRTIALTMPITFAFAAFVVTSCGTADHNALWKIVHDRCAPEQAGHHNPAPCALVNLAEGWAVYKDSHGNTQFLLIPTDRVTGVEDPSILASHAPNYWEAAWTARSFVQQRASGTLTNDMMALAINSQWARSQNQLHIHIDCTRQDVRDALHLMQPQVGTTWTNARILGQEYAIRWLSTADLHDKNVFALAAERLESGQRMDRETIALVGVTLPDGKSGFDVLAGRLGVGGNKGSAEVLQDHGCAIAVHSK
jgi:CDP-diacylglycerol pyrophosphatase